MPREVEDAEFGPGCEEEVRAATSYQSVRFRGLGLREAVLRQADLRTARGYRIDPASNRIGGLRASLPEAMSFLGVLGVRLEP